MMSMNVVMVMMKVMMVMMEVMMMALLIRLPGHDTHNQQEQEVKHQSTGR